MLRTAEITMNTACAFFGIKSVSAAQAHVRTMRTSCGSAYYGADGEQVHNKFLSEVQRQSE